MAALIHQSSTMARVIPITPMPIHLASANERMVRQMTVANMEFRKERAMRIDGMPEAKIEENILKMDKRRNNYYNFHTGEKWGKAENYSLCINSGRVGIDNAVQVIKAYCESYK